MEKEDIDDTERGISHAGQIRYFSSGQRKTSALRDFVKWEYLEMGVKITLILCCFGALQSLGQAGTLSPFQRL